MMSPDDFAQMGSNQLRVVLPVLQGSRRINEVERPLFVVAGTCLEPFVALLNHSCVGNSVWAFEGCQLRVRARTDIGKLFPVPKYPFSSTNGAS